MRVVVDPNVLVSAAVAPGVSAQLLDRWLRDRAFELVVCPSLIGELRDGLDRDCGADLLVSGDSDVIDLDADDVTVLTPRALLDRL